MAGPQERHTREGYYVVGEGLLGTPEAAPGTAIAMSMDADLRAFRFSRMGPKGRQLGDPARRLVGHHDFPTFRDAQCQAKSPVKSLDIARVWREGQEVRMEFAARSFLHRQVRSMTGSLVEVGLGKWSAADFKAALDAADRAACGPVAPPQGLYLTGVVYPD